MTPEDLAANREMVRDLNRLLQERLAGGDPGRVASSSRKHGRFFPGAQTLDDIIEQLAERMAAMQSLLRSMSPEQRAELQSMMDALLRDDRLRWDLAQLARRTWTSCCPAASASGCRSAATSRSASRARSRRWPSSRRSTGSRTQLDGRRVAGDLAGVDRDEVRDLLGDDAARDLEALDDLARRLEEAGYLTRDGERLELTPRGSRRIGQKVLDDLFARPPARRVRRPPDRPRRAGRGARGDDEAVRVRRPVPPRPPRRRWATRCGREENAPAAGRRRGDRRVRLAPADFEVFRTEQLTRTSTVLLVDMSRSMLLRGCFVAAKKVAVALDTLIRTQFPRDHLSVIGFAYYAREIRPGALAELSWHGYEYGTNLQHGLMLARRILARQHGGNKRDRGHHRRRADGALRGRPGRVQLPADAADDPGDAPRGAALHEGRASRSTRSCWSARGPWPSSSRS